MPLVQLRWVVLCQFCAKNTVGALEMARSGDALSKYIIAENSLGKNMAYVHIVIALEFEVLKVIS